MQSKALDKVKEAYEILVQWEADEAAGVAGTTDKPESPSASEALFAARMLLQKALRMPPRNCDVGTAEEQDARFLGFCRNQVRCEKCELYKRGGGLHHCRLRWAQMPYKAEEGGARC